MEKVNVQAKKTSPTRGDFLQNWPHSTAKNFAFLGEKGKKKLVSEVDVSPIVYGKQRRNCSSKSYRREFMSMLNVEKREGRMLL